MRASLESLIKGEDGIYWQEHTPKLMGTRLRSPSYLPFHKVLPHKCIQLRIHRAAAGLGTPSGGASGVC